ncbi:hypothetical protein MKX03_017247 [Papaver bracteatum]|nr:hypothetical protein MKX03_017247 [Papaver bracteatum]
MDVHSLVVVDDNKSNDRLALLDFKDGITEDPLGVLSTWNDKNDSLHFCQWNGVTCSRRHPSRVTMLNLSSQKLLGSISPHIGNLSFLKNLNLDNNSLNGEVPQQIGHLFRLQILDFSYNFLEGEIPENISRCSSLTYLDISNNKLVGRIPIQLGNLSNLQKMSLDSNNLSGEIPTSLGNFSSLTILILGYNNLKGKIPSTLGQPTSVQIVDIGMNKLSAFNCPFLLHLFYNIFIVPSSLYNISSLEMFSLGDNRLHGSIPFDIGFTLPNLIYLSIGTNNFTGIIPSSVSNLSRLDMLQLYDNNIVGAVPYLGNLPSLTWLYLKDINLGSGQANDLGFLNSLINCTNLELITIQNNNFENKIYGNVPAGIQNLVGLRTLSLGENQLTGSIPPGIGNLGNLKILDFRKNKLSGSIPSSFSNLTQLVELYLNVNNITGSISSLEYSESFQILDLNSNRLSGSVPKQILNLPSLSIYLDLSKNSFTGILPAEVGNLKNIWALSLSKNKLSGEIPSTIGECLSLTGLFLDGNYFQGNIPLAITYLKGLERLHLSRNNFSGVIPEGLDNLTTLRELDLSYNILEGAVPKDGVFANASKFSVEGNSRLCGGIPVLKLPNCSMPLNPNTKEKHKKSRPVKVIIIIIVVVGVLFFTLIVFFVTLYWKKKSKITTLPSTTLDIGKRYKGVSYNELLKATNGFNDSTNLIGVGSFGSVYKGILLEDGSKPVAVKVLHLQQKGATKSFMAECDALRKVRHRNLLKIITCCSSTDFQGNPFKALVFEFMANGNLGNWLYQD